MLDSSRLAGLPTGPFKLMYRMYRSIVPNVREELRGWRERAERIPDPELRRQAINSMTAKEFHCIGGAVYATGNMVRHRELVRLITAFQTISDYLDNLCDRSTSLHAADFRSLHQAMLDAVNPQGALHTYYEHRQESEDGGYLHDLVLTCREMISSLPSYSVVQPYVKDLVSLYCDLQVYKHIHQSEREEALLAWWRAHRERCPDLYWNEFAAAAGSTLGVFMLFIAASEGGLNDETAEALHAAYFPHLCALHILLDYLIDQEEDRRGGDLNFCAYYRSGDETVHRVEHIAAAARTSCSALPGAKFHRMIIEGLFALYLSDPKVSMQNDVQQISSRLMRSKPWIRGFFRLHSNWIRAR